MTVFDKKLLRPVWFEVDLDALRHNYKETRRLVGKDVRIIGALKCNAYGFGSLEVAEEIISLGAYGIAVADLLEAVNLRERGISCPVLLYANHLPSAADTIIKYNLMPTITEIDSAKMYSAKTGGSSLDVFVKVDVGLNRIGVLPENAVALVENLIMLKNISIAGIYTHFHFSGEDDYMNWQLSRFIAVVDDLRRKGIEIPLKMAAATPAILKYPQTYLNAVDPGRLLFGNTAEVKAKQEVFLRPVFKSLKTKIIERKTIRPRKEYNDKSVFPVQGEMVVGILPVGWGDGYSRKHSSVGSALTHGKRVSVLGGVHFEHTRIDLSNMPEAKIGDEVVLIGKQGNEEISLEEVVEIRGVDLQEVCQSVRSHIPTLYIKGGQPYKLKTLFGETFF